MRKYLSTSKILILLLTAHRSLARKEHGLRYGAVNDLQRRKAVSSGFFNSDMANTTTIEKCNPSLATSTPLTTVFPSPGATPIEVFNQSQIVTSYIPEATWCVGPPIGLLATATILGPPYLNASTLYSTTIGGTGYCETIYVSTTTSICATTLTGLASKVSNSGFIQIVPAKYSRKHY